jgi:acyl dehydratase
MQGKTAFFVRARRDPAAKEDKPARAPEPLPDPDWAVPQPVAEDQALRYAAASGDTNPIHVDPEVARKAGLPGCILHGLCTMAFAQRDLIARCAGGDPARLGEISVRFAGMVLPGQTLELRVWDHGDHLGFATFGPDGKPVITHGHAVVRSAEPQHA